MRFKPQVVLPQHDLINGVGVVDYIPASGSHEWTLIGIRLINDTNGVVCVFKPSLWVMNFIVTTNQFKRKS